jgi:AcrR family transcriptional regulator
MASPARREAVAPPAPKEWERRATLRSAGRATDGQVRDFAGDIIRAAWTVVHEGGGLDFTVRQVTERASVALQTFYRYFGNKDELLLAMLEESMIEAVGRILSRTKPDDPVEQLHTLVTEPIVQKYDAQAERMLRWRGRERQRLLERFPEAIEAVYEPYAHAIATAISAVCAAGRGRSETPELDARIILRVVQALAHDVHGGSMPDGPGDVAERLWRMVAATLAITETPPARRRR